MYCEAQRGLLLYFYLVNSERTYSQVFVTARSDEKTTALAWR